MRSKEEIKNRLEKELTGYVADPRESKAIAELIRQVRANVLKWVLENAEDEEK